MSKKALQFDEDTIKNNVSFNLRYLRHTKKPKMSQTLLAKRLGITRRSISSYEHGAVLPPVHVLAAVSDYFKISTDELLYTRLPHQPTKG